ncbi:MAG TPA: ABC transporter ATP-binding protein [Anaerohalosphaeraceae bacterium]|nr:ABC transporter ATP-binding protein [Anaerohalosphaeraceae bacterium]HOL30558.1 ABC transporter ATP-binding protein [Anaerohalosphaeraceae bacterium]HOM75041.1 ABC transporter ATP-binding protein [Anaerohalosphaeraceae bacterium]HPC63621.1 ABC transporter ATP-binding protein [Anaerohalosphaeraceae bacterium]HRS71199.1 ABC transporter ATP-binding protein [Anaerohalosphaeraceae bacterium]
MAADNQFAIETISLTKIFPDWWGRPKVIAVEDLNLKIRYNEIYGFLGPNGSGKTTTIKMLLELLYPTRGAAFVLGGKVSDPKISARIGYLPEESYLYRYLTARETLDFYGRIFGLPADIRKARIETLLEMVGLSGMGNRPIGTFSKGMARRIGLAQALINDPDLLILDEPTSGMDPMGTRQMKDLFIELARRGKTILLCSHLLADVEDVCDRIGILYGGRMQVEGTVRQLLQQSDETQIRTGRLSEAAIEQIRRIAASEGQVPEITNPMDKLENFFIRIVAKARQEKQRTSGAEVGTGIQGFLAEKPVVRPESVLQQLVAANVTAPAAPQGPQAAVTKPAPQPQPAAADRDLLGKLVQPVDAGVSQTAVETVQPASAPEKQDAVKRDVLEELIGKKRDGSTQLTQPVKAEDSKNA